MEEKKVEEAKSYVLAQRLPSPCACMSLRLRCGLTLQQLADIVGVTRSTIWRWERGLRSPRGELRRAYGEVLRGIEEVCRNGD